MTIEHRVRPNGARPAASSPDNGSNGGNGEEPSGKLGTFGGVFTPSLLTILGLVLFLRLGFVTGNVGLWGMLSILAMATSVSLLTSISLAAIATNLRVGGGGVYFLMSRTLGPAFGGSIGLVLYVAMSVSVAFYAIGLGEAVTSALGASSAGLPRIIAVATILALVGLAWLGADIATRLQYVVMGCLGVAIAAYFVGVVPDLSADQLAANLARPEGGRSFWVSFAIFFPAVTGFTQGVAMSGDLRDASRSITHGTFGAIGVSTLVYLVVIVTFAMAVPLATLRDDTAIMRTLAPAPVLVDVGVIAATLSSAIASILGAPRTLQRLAADRLIKPLEPFAVGAGPANNPRRAVVLSATIALATVAIGDLDVVAPVISMFFLASYGLINYATYSEARAASTSFRPTFRLFDWRLSLLGTLVCLGAIVAIDPAAGLSAGAAVYGLYRYLRRSGQRARWADSTRSFHAAEVRSHLWRMSVRSDASRDWRPCSVAFVPRDPERRSRLVTVASWFEGAAGFTTIARIVPGRGALARRHAREIETDLRRELSASELGVYGRVIVADDLAAGVSAMLQAHGIGALRPNLALFSWYDGSDPDRPNTKDYESMVQTGVRFGCNVAIVDASDEAWSRVPPSARRPPRIAVWWSDERSGQLLTLLAWLCTRTPSWGGAPIDVFVADDLDAPSGAGEDRCGRVRRLIDEARLPAEVIAAVGADRFAAAVGGAGLVLAPLRVRKGDLLGPGDVPIEELLPRLPVAVFVHTASEVRLDVQPDESELAALAEATDRALRASARADELSEEASVLMVSAELLRIEASGHAGGESGGVEPEGVVDEAHVAAARAQRRYLDARARAEEAWRRVREIDPSATTDQPDPALWLGVAPVEERHRA